MDSTTTLPTQTYVSAPVKEAADDGASRPTVDKEGDVEMGDNDTGASRWTGQHDVTDNSFQPNISTQKRFEKSAGQEDDVVQSPEGLLPSKRVYPTVYRYPIDPNQLPERAGTSNQGSAGDVSGEERPSKRFMRTRPGSSYSQTPSGTRDEETVERDQSEQKEVRNRGDMYPILPKRLAAEKKTAAENKAETAKSLERDPEPHSSAAYKGAQRASSYRPATCSSDHGQDEAGSV
jgi:hypothetical protein